MGAPCLCAMTRGVSVATVWPAYEPRLCGESMAFCSGCVTGRSRVPFVGSSMSNRGRKVPHPSVRAARAVAWWFQRPPRPRAGRLHRRPGWCDQTHSVSLPPLRPIPVSPLCHATRHPSQTRTPRRRRPRGGRRHHAGNRGSASGRRRRRRQRRGARGDTARPRAR